MKISKTLVNYLFNSNTLLETNILITNSSSIIYSNTYNNSLNYENISLTYDLKQLFNTWENPNSFTDYLILSNNFLELSPNENFSYKGQMILPLIHNNNLDGLLIFFRNNRNFVDSSLKYAKTIKKFVEIFTENDFVDKEV